MALGKAAALCLHKGMWLFLFVYTSSTINLYALHSPVSLSSLECWDFCSSMTDIQLFTLRNNPLVPYWKPRRICEDSIAWKAKQHFVCSLVLAIHEHSYEKGIYREGILGGKKNSTKKRQKERVWTFLTYLKRNLQNAGSWVKKQFLEMTNGENGTLLSADLTIYCKC